jgi:hypothetical protein
MFSIRLRAMASTTVKQPASPGLPSVPQHHNAPGPVAAIVAQLDLEVATRIHGPEEVEFVERVVARATRREWDGFVTHGPEARV